jgi:hypothetical protein
MKKEDFIGDSGLVAKIHGCSRKSSVRRSCNPLPFGFPLIMKSDSWGRGSGGGGEEMTMVERGGSRD